MNQLIKNDVPKCAIRLENFIPARYIFVALGFWGFNLVYAYKVVLSVVIVAMVNTSEAHKNDASQIGQECPFEGNMTDKINAKQGTFEWDNDLQGYVLGSFFYGYVITQIPGGILAEKFGGKWVLGCSMLMVALLSLVGPFFAHWNVYLFMATRILQGAGEGVAFPCMHSMLAKWFPKFERGSMSTIIYTGSQIGTVITLPLAAYLSDTNFLGGWPAIFYILGIAGILWFILWAVLIYETPYEHPYISNKELEFIQKGQGEEQVKHLRSPTPWKQMLTSIPVWALIITHLGQNWGFLTLLTELPSYFQKILHLDIKSNGLLSCLPYLLQAIMGWIAGFVSDKFRKSGILSVNAIRKVCNSIAFFGSGACLIGVSLAKCNFTSSVTFFTLALALNGFTYSGFAITHVDMSPEFAGILMGITNSIANIPGFMAPIVVSAFTNEAQTLASWANIFELSAGVYFLAGLVYIMFANAELQVWSSQAKYRAQNTRNNQVKYKLLEESDHNE